jgi:hypothetical protein
MKDMESVVWTWTNLNLKATVEIANSHGVTRQNTLGNQCSMAKVTEIVQSKRPPESQEEERDFPCAERKSW